MSYYPATIKALEQIHADHGFAPRMNFIQEAQKCSAALLSAGNLTEYQRGLVIEKFHSAIVPVEHNLFGLTSEQDALICKALKKDAKPDGLFYIRKAIGSKLAAKLVAWFQENEEKFFPVDDSANARRVMHWGHFYDYKTKRIKSGAPKMPQVVQELRESISGESSTDYFNQCIANLYEVGQGISPHTDHPGFGENIACFTLFGDREMEFTRGSETFRLMVADRSMYMMTGEARYAWKHAMRARQKDGKAMRKKTLSFTFRHVEK
jgi:alkylated DNA repair protein alkB family protein 8